jgi:hypothetical protein
MLFPDVRSRNPTRQGRPREHVSPAWWASGGLPCESNRARLNEGGSQSSAAMIDEAKSDQPLFRSLHGSRLQCALSAWSWSPVSLALRKLWRSQRTEAAILRRSSMNRGASLAQPLTAQPHRSPHRLVQDLGAPLEFQRYHQKIVAPGGLAFNAEHPVSRTRVVLECVADVAAVRVRNSVRLIADAAGFPFAAGLSQCSPQMVFSAWLQSTSPWR